MKLRIIQSIENDDYVMLFSIEEVSSNDRALIAKYGEQDIDFGGSFSSGEISFELPSTYRKLYSEFPVRKVFSAVTPFDTDTVNKLNIYRAAIDARIESAVYGLRDMDDTFTGEFVTNI